MNITMSHHNVVHHRNLCEELNKIYTAKNHDYGDSFHETFLEEGLAMSRIRLSDKLSRFKKLSKLNSSDSDAQKVKDESIRDTLMDLANYAVMTVLEMERAHMSHRDEAVSPGPTSFESGIEN